MKHRNYVIAVSGGVDSMVLLDALVHDRLTELTHYPLSTTHSQLTIAHFDHGIREESAGDEQFVRKMAEQYGIRYESARVELGANASEEEARKARYKFLRQCCNKYHAQLVTAHHQDDVTETMIINLIRGTGWRGLAPMEQFSIFNFQFSNNSQVLSNQNTKQVSVIPEKSGIQSSYLSGANHIPGSQPVWRPFISVSKQEILAYAKKYKVQWREDSTNTDTNYLRNYVRLQLIPAMKQKDPMAVQKFLKTYQNTTELKKEIATELQKYLIKYQLSNINYIVPRYDCIMLPSAAALEILYQLITTLDPNWHPSLAQLQRTLHFIKTAYVGKSMDITKRVRVVCTMREATFDLR